MPLRLQRPVHGVLDGVRQPVVSLRVPVPASRRRLVNGHLRPRAFVVFRARDLKMAAARAYAAQRWAGRCFRAAAVDCSALPCPTIAAAVAVVVVVCSRIQRSAAIRRCAIPDRLDPGNVWRWHVRYLKYPNQYVIIIIILLLQRPYWAAFWLYLYYTRSSCKRERERIENDARK